MNFRISFLCVAALAVLSVATSANAAVKKADCRYWQVDERTSPKATSDGPWGNPTGFTLILATTQRDLLAYLSTPARVDASEEYIRALERLLRRSGRE
jgi:hypothetical protein